MMASPPLTHPIVSAGSPDIRKRWECRCFAPWADDSSEENDDDSRASRHLHPTRQGNSYRAWSHNRPVPTYQKVGSSNLFGRAHKYRLTCTDTKTGLTANSV